MHVKNRWNALYFPKFKYQVNRMFLLSFATLFLLSQCWFTLSRTEFSWCLYPCENSSKGRCHILIILIHFSVREFLKSQPTRCVFTYDSLLDITSIILLQCMDVINYMINDLHPFYSSKYGEWFPVISKSCEHPGVMPCCGWTLSSIHHTESSFTNLCSLSPRQISNLNRDHYKTKKII